MPTNPIPDFITVDYLVVGTGAAAMAFVDTLIGEDPEATVLMVDRHHRPGGHWNDAYPFVRLHQPAAFYGVASLELGQDWKDETGSNAGLYSLASGAEVLAHFDRVMQQRFLPSGRVRWLPMTDWLGSADPVAGRSGLADTPAGQRGPVHALRCLTSGRTRRVQVVRKLVDGTQAQTAVPSTRPPKYALAPGVQCMPLNGLPQIRRPHASYTVVGSGKTGMDAILWLLDNGVEPSRVRWIMPRDAWLLDRANLQPGAENAERSVGAVIGQAECIAEAESPSDLLYRMEARGLLMRIDPRVMPTSYRCASVSRAELAQLRRVEDIVRLGHVQRIEPTRIVLDRGSLPAEPDTLYIDCSAPALSAATARSVFDGDRINLLMLHTCQPVYSAAQIAWVESHVSAPAEKAALCSVVPVPERPEHVLTMWAVTARNAERSQQNAALRAWLKQCRLNAMAVFLRDLPADDPRRTSLMQRVSQSAAAARARLPTLMAAEAVVA